MTVLETEEQVCATLEGQVVKVADEIAQRGHDVDDALTSGVMSVTTISEESEIIKSLSEKIDIMSLYCDPKKSQEAYETMKKINEE